jgi:hypothetical protein
MRHCAATPLYLGRHARRRGREYDVFIRRYVETASRLFPCALHFEAFGPEDARKILQAYGRGYRVFSDDVQGTGTICRVTDGGGHVDALLRVGIPGVGAERVQVRTQPHRRRVRRRDHRHRPRHPRGLPRGTQA